MWLASLFLIFLRLGCYSFGGPAAHLGYFHREFVERRQWLSERAYADLLALCQVLPGPASSQVGMAIGLLRGGMAGAVAAWAGFTLPSALLMVLFANGLSRWGEMQRGLHGLQVAAVAVVAQAVWSMGRRLGGDRIAFVVGSAAAALLLPGAAIQMAVIAATALAGALLIQTEKEVPEPLTLPGQVGLGPVVYLGVFLLLLVGLPVLQASWPNRELAMAASFYRTGSVVFGGGHVVLPLLEQVVVPSGWVLQATFLAGYGAAQAVPGPLFSFAAFLGAAAAPGSRSWAVALLCLLSIYLPSFLLVAGVVPIWSRLRKNRSLDGALAGVNAGVVGLLLAALYDPVWITAIRGRGDFVLALSALVALQFWKLPAWSVVLLAGVVGWLIRS